GGKKPITRRVKATRITVQSQRRRSCAPCSIFQAIGSSPWGLFPVSFPVRPCASSGSLVPRRSRGSAPVSVEISASLTEVAAISHSLQLLFGRQRHTHSGVIPFAPAMGFVDPPRSAAQAGQFAQLGDLLGEGHAG